MAGGKWRDTARQEYHYLSLNLICQTVNRIRRAVESSGSPYGLCSILNSGMKSIIFDFGNVIGFFDHRRASTRLAEHSDLPADLLHAVLWGGQLEDDYEAGRISTAEFLRRLREQGRICCPDETLSSLYSDIFYAPNPDVVALLPRLKARYRLLLASNTNDLHAKQFIPQFADALRWFEALLLSHEMGARKPHLQFFQHCQRFAGCPPEECLFIDDLAANVAGARSHGWQAIQYTGFEDLRNQLTRMGILDF